MQVRDCNLCWIFLTCSSNRVVQAVSMTQPAPVVAQCLQFTRVHEMKPKLSLQNQDEVELCAEFNL